ncbi:glucosyltransferase [Coemansia erecta]|uniref:Dol-P-Glc:Glc(2)Man(9)GlcNAc(2)-PP-Dol alpha-1,2-glucosyltransferase n=1 Tax=Coemansia erecta TaxID=147472 RepID=A0A9W8CQZ5_9FUNG|nr:glucosyltransferase [Coemansia erecta]
MTAHRHGLPAAQESTAGLWAAFAVYSAVSYAVLQQVNMEVEAPYMDEIFHIPQAQQYCQGRFADWDPKLTTPPGLYLVSTTMHSALPICQGLWGQDSSCTVAFLRTTNWLASLSVFWLAADIRRHVTNRQPTVGEILGLALYPVAFFFHHVYYTDTLSLALVLACYAMRLRARPWVAAACGFAALWLRQTNVIWVAFVGLTALLHRADAEDSLAALFRWVLGRSDGQGGWRATLGIALPYALVGCAFIVFVLYNGGIVLGDKAHHAAVLHFPQAFYFLGFTAAISLPTFLWHAAPHQLWRTAVQRHGAIRTLLCLALTATAMCIAVQRYTIEHAFLLSDNRHYAFYVWKDVFRRHWAARYVVVVGYVWAAWAATRVVRQGWVWQAGLTGCLAAVLVPSPLLEFRYFTVGWFFVRMHARRVPGAVQWAEVAWMAVINALTIWVFLRRPFVWPSEPGAAQRFMW